MTSILASMLFSTVVFDDTLENIRRRAGEPVRPVVADGITDNAPAMQAQADRLALSAMVDGLHQWISEHHSYEPGDQDR